MVVLMSAAFWLGVPAAASREHDEDTGQHRNVVALTAGITHEGRRDNEPSVGIEYERRIGLRLGVGLLIEHTFADEDFTVFAMPIAVHFDRLKLFAAPGIEDSEIGSEAMLRLGAEYAFEWGRYEIAPQLDIDFVDGEQVVVAGVAIGLPF